ncbi:hypothetical protein Tco_0276043 [Tanacetum coccineum]
MATTAAQQIALDNVLVAPEKQVEIGKCNMRIDSENTQKEPTYQVVLDALALTTCYPAFLITANVPVIYMQQSIQRDSPDLSRLPDQEFDEPPFEEEIISFIKELGHTGNIKNIAVVVVDHMRQPWRTFASVINKCLSGKITGLDKIRLSRAQILWGMYYKRNTDYVALLWEDFSFQIDNRDIKKQEKMYHPRFTKAIIHHFLSKDKSISMRNRMFMHMAQDDIILGTLRFVSKDEDTQVYGALIPAVMTTPKIRDSPAYQTYLAFATRTATPKLKRIYKKHDSPMIKTTTTSPEETPSKKKSSLAKKDVSSKKPSKKYANKGTGTKPGVSDLPKDQSKSENESLGESADDDDSNDDDSDDVSDDDDGNDDDSNDDGNNDASDNERTESDEDENTNLNQNDDDDIKEEYKEEYVHTPENYESTDMKRKHREEGKGDAEMTDVGHDNVTQETTYDQVEDDAHVTLTSAHVTQKTEGPLQSSSVSSDFTTQFLILDNVPQADNEIISIMNVKRLQQPFLSYSSIHSSSTTININSHIKTEATTSLPVIPDFSSQFGFNQRVYVLEKVLSQLKQVDHSAKLLEAIKSQVPAVVEAHLGTRHGNTIQQVLQEEVKSEIEKYMEFMEKFVKANIIDQVKNQLPHILPKEVSDFATPVIQSTIAESLENVILAKSSSQPQSTY